MSYEVGLRGKGDGEWGLGHSTDLVLRTRMTSVWVQSTEGGYPPGEGSMTFVHGLTNIAGHQTQGEGGPLQQEEWSKLWEGVDNYGLAMMMEGVGINQERWGMIHSVVTKLEKCVLKNAGVGAAIILEVDQKYGESRILFWDNMLQIFRMSVNATDESNNLVVEYKFVEGKVTNFSVEGSDPEMSIIKKREGIDNIMTFVTSVLNNPKTVVTVMGEDGFYEQFNSL
jgi:hypothetical protein